MHTEIKKSDVFWITLGGMEIEINYFVYEKYTKVFANYYYAGEDSITGYGKSRTTKLAIKRAILHLFNQRVRQRRN